MRDSYHTLGLLTPFLAHPSFVQRVRGIQRVLDEDWRSDILVLYRVGNPQHIERHIERILKDRLVDGLIVNAIPLTDDNIERFTQSGIPLVRIFDRPIPGTPTIGINNYRGGYLATAHLINRGHTHIAYIGDLFPDEYGFPTSEDRFAGYKTALTEQRIRVDTAYHVFMQRGDTDVQPHLRRLLALPEPPTAIFAMSDLQALKIIAALSEIGLRVPDFMSVIGFDDIDTSAYSGLTTIRQHLDEGGMLAMQMLKSLLNGDETWRYLELPSLEVIERSTTTYAHLLT